MTPDEPAKDIIRLIACRNLQYAIRILEDSETDMWRAGMTDEYDQLSEIISRMGDLRLAMDAKCREEDE